MRKNVWHRFLGLDPEPEFLPTAHLHPRPRPCEADGKPAMFHRWVEEDQVRLQVNIFCREDEMRQLRQNMDRHGVVPPGCSCQTVRHTFALVEYLDGSVGKVAPELIQFTDKEEVRS